MRQTSKSKSSRLFSLPGKVKLVNCNPLPRAVSNYFVWNILNGFLDHSDALDHVLVRSAVKEEPQDLPPQPQVQIKDEPIDPNEEQENLPRPKIPEKKAGRPKKEKG